LLYLTTLATGCRTEPESQP